MSIHAAERTLLTKNLQPLPEKFHGLTNTDLRYRQRYVDLIMNDEVKGTFVKRSKIISTIREYLDDLEDLYLAEKRLSEIRARQRETIPIEEVIQAEERHPRPWHLLLNDPVADDDSLKERLPIIDESRFIKGFE